MKRFTYYALGMSVTDSKELDELVEQGPNSILLIRLSASSKKANWYHHRVSEMRQVEMETVVPERTWSSEEVEKVYVQRAIKHFRIQFVETEFTIFVINHL